MSETGTGPLTAEADATLAETRPSGPPVLSVRDLQVHFPMPGGGLFRRSPDVLKAVDGVSFDLAAGETLGVVGESGCGKSTLGRAILQLIPSTGGRVVWMGEDIAGLDDKALRARRQDMQIIFQDPLASLDPRMTVGDIVAEPLDTFRPEMSRQDRREAVRRMLREVGLMPEMINRYPHEFSGGQCQRIGIARAMILEPRLVICDEPVSALDVSIQSQIINLLMDLQRRYGLAMIFISHDLSVVRHIAHRILVLYLGRIAEFGDRDALYDDPRHPYTQALISAVPLPDPDRERAKQRIVLHGDLPSPLNPPSGCAFRTRCPKATHHCAEQDPPPYPVRAGQVAACHYWDTETPAG
ncbi:MAG: dipeptide ABC transporter ATP-binding protein [Azospirillaceae bacterium]